MNYIGNFLKKNHSDQLFKINKKLINWHVSISNKLNSTLKQAEIEKLTNVRSKISGQSVHIDPFLQYDD